MSGKANWIGQFGSGLPANPEGSAFLIKYTIKIGMDWVNNPPRTAVAGALKSDVPPIQCNTVKPDNLTHALRAVSFELSDLTNV